MELSSLRSEFDPKPTVPPALLEGPLAALIEWQAMAEGAYSPNTLRAQKADGAIFQAYCESRGQPYLPADPKTIRAFIEDRVMAGKKPATVRRYAATIARVHAAAGLLNPCSSEAVRLGLKKMGRETSARQDQAHPLGWKDIKEFIDGAGEGLRADRERAMLCVAYETLSRRGELVALEVKDIDFHPDGTGIALIRRGKTDAEGQGRAAYLSRETMRWLRVWLENAGIQEGALFRRLIGQSQIGGPLNPGSIAPIFKRVAQWIGMPGRFVGHISGHSTRVGATQDLAALDIDLAAITQAGGFRSADGSLKLLGSLGGNNGNATALNDLNQVVGYSSIGPSQPIHGFFWSANDQLQDLEADLQLGTDFGVVNRANGINNAGYIAVVGRNASQRIRGAILTFLGYKLVPHPTPVGKLKVPFIPIYPPLPWLHHYLASISLASTASNVSPHLRSQVFDLALEQLAVTKSLIEAERTKATE